MKQVLIIEDELLIRECYAFALSDRGHQVRGTASGKEGVQLFAEYQPDVVILDVLLPEMNGQDVYQEIRTLCSHCRILVASADSRSSVRHLFPADPNLSVYQKPIPLQRLIQFVEADMA